VLQEVGEAALILLFKNRTYLLRNVEVDLILGLLVMSDVIGQTVVEMSDSYLRVNGDGRHLTLR
jgi:hypothetical protein